MKNLYNLYILIITQGLSLIGSRMSAIAIGIWLYQTKGSTTYLLLIPFFNEVSSIIFGGIAGVVVDKWKRKYAMIFGDLGQGLGTAILFLCIATGKFHIYNLYTVVTLQGIFSLFESIAADAATTMMAPESHREKANAIKEMTFPAASIAAPVLSGFLYALIGIKGILILDFTTFMIALIVLLIINVPEPEKSVETSKNKKDIFKDSFMGFSFLIKNRALLKLTLYITFTNFMLNGPLELIIPYITKITGDEFIVSFMLSIMGIGALIGAAVIAVWGGTRPRINTIIPGMIVNGLMFIAFGIFRTTSLLAVVLCILMIPLPAVNALFKSIIQLKTPPEIQGRVFAAIAQLSNMVVPISFLLTGFLVDKVFEPLVNGVRWKYFEQIFGNSQGSGIGLLLALTGTIILAGSIVVYLMPNVRELETVLPDYEEYK